MNYRIKFTASVELTSVASTPLEDFDDSFEMETTADLPYLPRKGDRLGIFKGDELRLVKKCYWTIDEGFEIYLTSTMGSMDRKACTAIGWTVL